MFEEDDIHNLLQQETSRGSKRRRFDPEERARQRKLREGFVQLLREGDEARFTDWLKLRGWHDDSPQFRKLIAIWHEYQRSRKP